MDYTPIVFVLLALGGIVWWVRGKARRLEQARLAYQQSLNKLKVDPTNADLKQRTLALGRAYSTLTRDSRNVTLFDEVALSNDINEACAAATRNIAAPVSHNVENRLARLAELQSRGLISAGEFQEQRSRILQEL
jgi:hypothetical protein